MIIIGSGPAGYTAAIYAARAGKKPIIYEGMQPGGQLTTTVTIENFPGFPEGIDTYTLMDNMRKQAESFGAEIRVGQVTAIDLSQRPFKLTIDDSETVTDDVVVVATGASARYLGIESEKRFIGRGVSACATCDGFFYRGKTVAVVGGGDTACAEALYLATLAQKVYMIVRRDVLRATKILQERVYNNEKITVLHNAQVSELQGADALECADLVFTDGHHEVITIDGIFMAIGHTPNTAFLNGALETDEKGYIVTRPGSQQTSVDGVYACGDVCDPHFRQAITAAAAGCRAAMEIIGG